MPSIIVMCSKFHLDLTKETFLDQRNTELLVPDEGECVLNARESEELLTDQLFS